MGRPFGMWVEHGFRSPRGTGCLVSGPSFGVPPESGAAVLARGAFQGKIRAHAASVGVPARGADGSQPTLLLPDAPGHPLTYVGGVIHEEGVACRAFSAVLSRPEPALRQSAKLRLRHDTAWALVSVRGTLLVIVVLGGGLDPPGALWDQLACIEARDGTIIRRESIAKPIVYPVWGVNVLKTYGGGENLGVHVVTAPCGPAERGEQPIVADDRVVQASVLDQSETGVVQIQLARPHPKPLAFVAGVTRSEDEQEAA